MMSGPPVTFLLRLYQQEPYVREAVRSVLAQDYRPLEIIVSDDASGDATFEIAKEEAARYRGPHRLLLNRNRENLNREHINLLLGLARGRLLVHGHGDDIARPDRTRRLVEALIARKASLVTSNATMITAEGQPLGPLSRIAHNGWVQIEHLIESDHLRTTVGATFATDRAIYDRFPRIDRKVHPVALDHIVPFRAALLGGIYYLAEPLLAYRQHDRSMSSRIVDRTGDRQTRSETAYGLTVWSQLCRLDELAAFARGQPDNPRLEQIRGLLERRILALAGAWVDIRGELRARGFRPDWINQEEFERRALNPDLMLLPRSALQRTSG